MEIWKNVAGFENEYEISSLGNLRSKERFVKHYKGGLRKYKPSLKNQRLNKNGYKRCNLKINNKRFDFTIHQLVARAFLQSDINRIFVNHKNGIKTDNRVENLEWVTLSENTIHAVKERLIKTKLTDIQVLEISNNKLSTRKIAKLYGVNSNTIWRIKNKKSYKHLW